MARSKKYSPRSIVLHRNVAIEATPLPFRPFESVRHLDVARLCRAAHARLELGYFDTGCCRRILHAVVRKGKVVKLELEPCKQPVAATPDLKKAVGAAVRRIAARERASVSLPVPVHQFLAEESSFHVSAWFCIKICCFGHCIMCCTHFIPPPFWLGCAIDSRPTPTFPL